MRIPFLSLLAVTAAGLPSCTGTAGSVGRYARSSDPIGLRHSATIDREPNAIRFEPVPESRGNNGPWEMTLGGAGSSNDSLDAGAVQATGSAGYYFNECVELSVRQNSAYSDAGPGSSSSWSSTSRAALDFHIPLGNFVPFFGANLGYVYGDGVNDSLTAGPEAGLKAYVKEDVFVLVAVVLAWGGATDPASAQDRALTQSTAAFVEDVADLLLAIAQVQQQRTEGSAHADASSVAS